MAGCFLSRLVVPEACRRRRRGSVMGPIWTRGRGRCARPRRADRPTKRWRTRTGQRVLHRELAQQRTGKEGRQFNLTSCACSVLHLLPLPCSEVQALHLPSSPVVPCPLPAVRRCRTLISSPCFSVLLPLLQRRIWLCCTGRWQHRVVSPSRPCHLTVKVTAVRLI